MSLKSVQVLHHILDMLNKDPLVLGKELQLGNIADLYYIALLLPYKNYQYPVKGKPRSVFEYVINDGLKALTIADLN